MEGEAEAEHEEGHESGDGHESDEEKVEWGDSDAEHSPKTEAAVSPQVPQAEFVRRFCDRLGD